MAHDRRWRSHDSRDRLRITSPRRDHLPGRNRLPAETARDDTGAHDRAAIARAAGTGLPAQGTSGAGSPAPIRLLDTQARGHIGRRVLRQQPDGELTEDPVWRWSSAPDRYLETALRLELASSPVLQLVDMASAPTLATTLLVWHLETTGGGTRLVGAVEFQVTRADQVVQTQRRASK